MARVVCVLGNSIPFAYVIHEGMDGIFGEILASRQVVVVGVFLATGFVLFFFEGGRSLIGGWKF